MLYSIKNREDLEKLEELVSLQSQVKAMGLQDKLGEQNYHHETEKLCEPVVDIIKNTFEKITKTLTENSVNINEVIENLNEKKLELINDKGLIATYLAFSLVMLLQPENKSQIKLIKNHKSTNMNDFSMNGGIPVTLFSNMLVFRDSIKSFKLDEDLLETISNYDFNVSLSNPKDQKLDYETGKQMIINIKQKTTKK